LHKGKLIVGFHPNVCRQDCLDAHAMAEAVLLEEIPHISVHMVSVHDEDKCTSLYLSCQYVRYVEKMKTYQAIFDPNDPLYPQQWGLIQTAATIAWNNESLRSLTKAAKIAVLDTGVDPEHPDLKDKLITGFNSFNNSTITTDGHGHGTHVAGIAAAITNNATGVAGVSYNAVDIVPVQVLDAQGSGSNLSVAKGILYAANHEAHVISMSLGGSAYSQVIQDAINIAWENNCVIIAAAGNNSSQAPIYPAGNNYVLAVSATTRSDTLASFSNYGADVGAGAPGESILSTLPTYTTALTRLGYSKNYDKLSGTSMSTPFVSGLAAMLAALNPGISNMEIVQTMQRSADGGTSKKWNPLFGYGRINVSKAVEKTFVNGKGGFYGQVVNNKLPVSNARVKVGNVSYRTKSNGMFRIANLKPGTYPIYVNKRMVSTGESIIGGCDTYLQLTYVKQSKKSRRLRKHETFAKHYYSSGQNHPSGPGHKPHHLRGY
jgi:thermitase